MKKYKNPKGEMAEDDDSSIAPGVGA